MILIGRGVVRDDGDSKGIWRFQHIALSDPDKIAVRFLMGGCSWKCLVTLKGVPLQF